MFVKAKLKLPVSAKLKLPLFCKVKISTFPKRENCLKVPVGTALSLAPSVAPEVQTMDTCNLLLSPDRDGHVCHPRSVPFESVASKPFPLELSQFLKCTG